MMLYNHNGKIEELPPEREAEIRKEMERVISPDPSPEERLQKLETENAELKAMIQKLSEV